MIAMRGFIESFIESLSAEKGFSSNTCRAYRNDLEQFRAYLRASGASASGPLNRVEEVDLSNVDWSNGVL